ASRMHRSSRARSPPRWRPPSAPMPTLCVKRRRRPVPSASSESARVVLPTDVALHARPAGTVVRDASRFDADVVLEANGRTANAKSILEVLALGATGGTEVLVSAHGAAAAEAVASLSSLLSALGY